MPEFSLTTPPTFCLSKERFVLYFLFLGSTPDVYDLRIKLTVKMKYEIETDYKTFVLEGQADATGEIYFDLTDMIDEYLGDEFTVPDPALNIIQLLEKCRLLLNVAVEEYRDGIQVGNYYVGGEEEPADFIIYKGGLTHKKRHLYNYFDWKMTIWSPTLPFHTWKPNERIIDKVMPATLTYSQQDIAATNDFLCELKIYAGGTLITSNTVNTASGALPLLPKIFPVGWVAMDIEGLVGATAYDESQVTHYTVQLIDTVTNDPVSQLITFYIDKKFYQEKTYLCYQNGIGGWDEVRFTGDVTTKAEYERSVGALSKRLGQYIDGLRKTYNVREQEYLRIYTQYMSHDEINNLREIMIAPRIFLFENNRYWALEPTEKSKELMDSGKFTQGSFIEFRYEFNDEVFMPKSSFNIPT